MDCVFDSIVIGAGPAGSTTAFFLARAGWRVALIEKAVFPRRKVCGEFVSATNLPLLRLMGLQDAFLSRAGPEVRHLGLFACEEALVTEMPRLEGTALGWGRALGRETLDALLLENASAAGAIVYQPCSATELRRDAGGFQCGVFRHDTKTTLQLRSRIVVAAHGSWEPGRLPTQGPRAPGKNSDLIGFKAHFDGDALPPGLMPLFVFPGGYGGMVRTDRGRLSVSLCVRRDRLLRCRERDPGTTAAAAAILHVQRSCRGVREVLAKARSDGPWLAAGPIQPGIRQSQEAGIFLVGNAAGEAHPIVAEGLSIAIQSGWLLAELLRAHSADFHTKDYCATVAERYAALWREGFAQRVRASAAFARVAISPAAVAAALPLFRWFPQMLGQGAKWSGKVSTVENLLTP